MIVLKRLAPLKDFARSLNGEWVCVRVSSLACCFNWQCFHSFLHWPCHLGLFALGYEIRHIPLPNTTSDSSFLLCCYRSAGKTCLCLSVSIFVCLFLTPSRPPSLMLGSMTVCASVSKSVCVCVCVCAVSYTHLTLRRDVLCRSLWSPYH